MEIPVAIASQWIFSLPSIRRILLYLSIGIAIGIGYSKVAHTTLTFGLINGITITLFVGLFELFLERTLAGKRIRRAHFVFYSLFVLSIWVVLILTSLEWATHFVARMDINTGDPLRHQIKLALFTDIAAAIFFIYSVMLLNV